MATLTGLLAPGVIGTYTHFEATEVFAAQDRQSKPINIFTILVAEDRQGHVIPKLSYLTPKPFRLKTALPD